MTLGIGFKTSRYFAIVALCVFFFVVSLLRISDRSRHDNKVTVSLLPACSVPGSFVKETPTQTWLRQSIAWATFRVVFSLPLFHRSSFKSLNFIYLELTFFNHFIFVSFMNDGHFCFFLSALWTDKWLIFKMFTSRKNAMLEAFFSLQNSMAFH